MKKNFRILQAYASKYNQTHLLKLATEGKDLGNGIKTVGNVYYLRIAEELPAKLDEKGQPITKDGAVVKVDSLQLDLAEFTVTPKLIERQHGDKKVEVTVHMLEDKGA